MHASNSPLVVPSPSTGLRKRQAGASRGTKQTARYRLIGRPVRRVSRYDIYANENVWYILYIYCIHVQRNHKVNVKLKDNKVYGYS